MGGGGKLGSLLGGGGHKFVERRRADVRCRSDTSQLPFSECPARSVTEYYKCTWQTRGNDRSSLSFFCQIKLVINTSNMYYTCTYMFATLPVERPSSRPRWCLLRWRPPPHLRCVGECLCLFCLFSPLPPSAVFFCAPRWEYAAVVLTHDDEKSPRIGSCAPQTELISGFDMLPDLEKTIDRKHATAVKVEAHFSCRRHQSVTPVRVRMRVPPNRAQQQTAHPTRRGLACAMFLGVGPRDVLLRPTPPPPRPVTPSAREPRPILWLPNRRR